MESCRRHMTFEPETKDFITDCSIRDWPEYQHFIESDPQFPQDDTENCMTMEDSVCYITGEEPQV